MSKITTLLNDSIRRGTVHARFAVFVIVLELRL